MTKTNKSDAGSIIDTFQTGPENLYYTPPQKSGPKGRRL